MQSDTHQLLTVLSILISLGTIAFSIWKGRDIVAKAALEALGSLEGRNIVVAITTEKHDRVEEKLDKIEAKLDALTTAMNAFAVRIAVVENNK